MVPALQAIDPLRRFSAAIRRCMETIQSVVSHMLERPNVDEGIYRFVEDRTSYEDV
jgi:hypothetical protein